MTAHNTQSQRQVQGQVQHIAPQMRQSLKILQISALELRNAIQEELQVNPTLEELPMDEISIEASSSEEKNESEDDFNDDVFDSNSELEIFQQIEEDRRDNFDYNITERHTAQDDQRRQHFLDSLVNETSLQEHLIGQAELIGCEDAVLEGIRFLIGSLDDNGFLSAPLKELASLAQMPLSTIETAHELLKTFDPVGIGCFSIQDCLLSQLESREEPCSVAIKILKDHYPLFLRRRVQELAQKIGTSVKQIEKSIELIITLDPDPGSQFREDTNRAVMPDVSISKQRQGWQITLNSNYIPRLRINNAYKDLLAQSRIGDKDKEYLKDKIRSGKFLISAIEQRQQTLEKIANQILDLQIEFFENGKSSLKPLTMAEIAQRVDLHETTISRAIANKYMETPHGVLEFKYFFTSGFTASDGKEVSNTTIKDKIAHFIASEDPIKPLSDQKLVELLKKENLDLARRTVAKYRDELGIPATSLRRRF